MFCALLGQSGERLQDHWSSGFTLRIQYVCQFHWVVGMTKHKTFVGLTISILHDFSSYDSFM